jgi:hypothetical protein
MTNHDDQRPVPIPTQDSGEALDQIRADRACAGCGFNLFGQSVTKEEHYGLAVARCPECGTVAALQQYPAMTHWVNRFRMIIGAFYILILLAFFVGSTFAVSGFMFGSTNVASDRLSDYLVDDYTAWIAVQNGEAETIEQALAAPSTTRYWYSNMDRKYASDRFDQAVDNFGSLWSNMDREWVIIMVPAACVCFAFGTFWSITLLGCTRKRALLVPLVSCMIGATVTFGVNQIDLVNASVRDIATQLYIPVVVPIVLIIELVAIAAGIFLGRKLARFVIRIALPARARVPFSIFWARDELELPRPG